MERFHIELWDQWVGAPEIVPKRVDLRNSRFSDRIVNGVGIGSLHASAAIVH